MTQTNWGSTQIKKKVSLTKEVHFLKVPHTQLGSVKFFLVLDINALIFFFFFRNIEPWKVITAILRHQDYHTAQVQVVRDTHTPKLHPTAAQGTRSVN